VRKRYFLYGRTDTIARNRDLLALWRDIGLERIFVGLESFRAVDLKDIRKGSTLADNEAAVRILHDLEIEIYGSFIVRPDFGLDDFSGLARYSRDLELGFPSFAILTPLPGTDFYDEVREQMVTHDYDLFDFLHALLPTELPLEEFYREMYRLNMRAMSMKSRLALARKIPLGDLPRFLMASQRYLNRQRKAHLDHYPESE
jgi:radical SAM superfamily enzyme YgiQ (UPF0313 family)